MRFLRDFVLRVVLVLLATSLCSFVALDQSVLRVTYLAIADFVTFLLNLGGQTAPLLGRVWGAYWRSLLLLASAMIAGLVIGIPLGLVVGTRERTILGRVVSLVSYVGTLTPSFLFGLFVMVFFVRFLGARTGLQWIIIAPSDGLPGPREVIAPALTLAARPIAHIAQVTAVQVHEQLRLGYVQTARSKGLRGIQVLLGHIWPNVVVSVLTALSGSLLFSLSSLPIVEYIFSWNGVGFTLFQAVLGHRTVLAAMLLAAVGLTFVAVTTLVDLLSARADPRLAIEQESSP